MEDASPAVLGEGDGLFDAVSVLGGVAAIDNTLLWIKIVVGQKAETIERQLLQFHEKSISDETTTSSRARHQGMKKSCIDARCKILDYNE